MLPDPIVVSDDEIKEGDLYLNGNGVFKCSNKESGTCELAVNSLAKYNKKIIAGIPELPSIDFSALSDEDCKRIGWVDVEKLAHKAAQQRFRLTHIPLDNIHEYGGEILTFIETWMMGFKTAQSLNDKKFTEKQMIDAVLQGMQKGMAIMNDIPETDNDWINNYVKRLAQPKVFDIEVEMEEKTNWIETNNGMTSTPVNYLIPKITNNSIKITKIL